MIEINTLTPPRPTTKGPVKQPVQREHTDPTRPDQAHRPGREQQRLSQTDTQDHQRQRNDQQHPRRHCRRPAPATSARSTTQHPTQLRILPRQIIGQRVQTTPLLIGQPHSRARPGTGTPASRAIASPHPLIHARQTSTPTWPA